MARQQKPAKGASKRTDKPSLVQYIPTSTVWSVNTIKNKSTRADMLLFLRSEGYDIAQFKGHKNVELAERIRSIQQEYEQRRRQGDTNAGMNGPPGITTGGSANAGPVLTSSVSIDSIRDSIARSLIGQADGRGVRKTASRKAAVPKARRGQVPTPTSRPSQGASGLPYQLTTPLPEQNLDGGQGSSSHNPVVPGTQEALGAAEYPVLPVPVPGLEPNHLLQYPSVRQDEDVRPEATTESPRSGRGDRSGAGRRGRRGARPEARKAGTVPVVSTTINSGITKSRGNRNRKGRQGRAISQALERDDNLLHDLLPVERAVPTLPAVEPNAGYGGNHTVRAVDVSMPQEFYDLLQYSEELTAAPFFESEVDNAEPSFREPLAPVHENMVSRINNVYNTAAGVDHGTRYHGVENTFLASVGNTDPASNAQSGFNFGADIRMEEIPTPFDDPTLGYDLAWASGLNSDIEAEVFAMLDMSFEDVENRAASPEMPPSPEMAPRPEIPLSPKMAPASIYPDPSAGSDYDLPYFGGSFDPEPPIPRAVSRSPTGPIRRRSHYKSRHEPYGRAGRRT